MNSSSPEVASVAASADQLTFLVNYYQNLDSAAYGDDNNNSNRNGGIRYRNGLKMLPKRLINLHEWLSPIYHDKRPKSNFVRFIYVTYRKCCTY